MPNTVKLPELPDTVAVPVVVPAASLTERLPAAPPETLALPRFELQVPGLVGVNFRLVPVCVAVLGAAGFDETVPVVPPPVQVIETNPELKTSFPLVGAVSVSPTATFAPPTDPVVNTSAAAAALVPRPRLATSIVARDDSITTNFRMF